MMILKHQKITSVQIDDSQDFNITSKNDTCSFKMTTSELINVNNCYFSISANNSEYLASRIELIDESKCEYLVTIFTTNRSFDGVYSINKEKLAREGLARRDLARPTLARLYLARANLAREHLARTHLASWDLASHDLAS